jgi:carbon-monoxide dehydrogenase medium subunit
MGRVERFTPESLEELAALLLAVDEGSRPLIHGTELTARISPPVDGSLVLDLSRVPELNRLDFDERDGLRIGAAVSLGQVGAFAPTLSHYRGVADGFADCRRGGDGSTTLGEALSRPWATPGAILPLLCSQAAVAVFGPYGWSELAIEVFCQPGRPACQFGEFVAHLGMPAPPPRSAGAYVSRTEAGGEVRASSVLLAMEDDLATCCGARVLCWAAEGWPERAVESERLLAGRRLDELLLVRAGETAERIMADPPGRAGVSGGLVGEALRLAWERVRPVGR